MSPRIGMLVLLSVAAVVAWWSQGVSEVPSQDPTAAAASGERPRRPEPRSHSSVVRGAVPVPAQREEEITSGVLADQVRDEARKDIHAAIARVAALPPGWRAVGAEALVVQLAEDDPASALEAAELFGVGLGDGRAERIMQLWTEQEPGEALAWLEARPDGLVRNRLAARAAWARAPRDPVDAARIVAELVAGPTQPEAVLGVVRQWAAHDPIGAADWVAGFSDAPLRSEAERILARALGI